jgi:hypothetical protein
MNDSFIGRVALPHAVTSGTMRGRRDQPDSPDASRKEHVSLMTGPEAATNSATRRLLGQPAVDAARALTLFDRLDPVDDGFLLGRWRGEELWTHHRLNGLLSAFGWYGKEFLPQGRAHPLIFRDSEGQVFPVDPMWMPASLALRLPALAGRIACSSAPLTRPLLKLLRTDEPCARVEYREYRGRRGAAMVYDRLTVTDMFRRIDDESLLGTMVTPATSDPFFFVLQRDRGAGEPGARP